MTNEDKTQSRTDRLRRMAAVGFLTRSFTHEFNNVLGTVLGSAHLLAMRTADPALQTRLTALVAATKQAIELSRSLGALALDPRGGARRGLDVHALLRALSEATAEPARAPTMSLDPRASSCHVDGDEGSLGEALAIVAEAVARGVGRTLVSTANCGQVSSRDTGDGIDQGDAWLRITFACDVPPLSEARRQVLMQPLSASPDDDGAVLLAGAIAVIRQGRGRVLSPEDAARSEIQVFLPTVSAPKADEE